MKVITNERAGRQAKKKENSFTSIRDDLRAAGNDNLTRNRCPCTEGFSIAPRQQQVSSDQPIRSSDVINLLPAKETMVGGLDDDIKAFVSVWQDLHFQEW